jgi:hypothetical protein
LKRASKAMVSRLNRIPYSFINLFLASNLKGDPFKLMCGQSHPEIPKPIPTKQSV